MDKGEELFEDIENIIRKQYHILPGYIYKDLRKQHALACLNKKEELKAICSLCETHAPSQKIRASYRYNKQSSTANNGRTMNTEYLSYDCLPSFNEQIERMIDKTDEMPKEWTIIQITTQYNNEESLRVDLSKIYTDPLHISVFICGQSTLKPFNINIKAPRDLFGRPIEICEEMNLFMESNKNLLETSAVCAEKLSAKQKLTFHERRQSLQAQILGIVEQIQRKWLGKWRCLLIGKMINTKKEQRIMSKINDILKENKSGFKITDKIQYLLNKITFGSEYLNKSEIMQAVEYCIPNNKELKQKIVNTILEISNSYQMKKEKRHPVILIIDEKLDFFPWEMIDVLIDHPVSRMPSLDFTYALFKEHEKSIVNGFKTVKLVKGSYLVNPSLDLKKMEARLQNFFKYWLPKWKGVIGRTPEKEEFIECIHSGEIFIYNGHGSGAQYLPGGRIQQTRVNSIILLFGCSSLGKERNGPLVEMYDFFYNYLIACSPCVVGLLWNVTDFDTDMLSTDLISFWVPSETLPHWKHVDKLEWAKGNIASLPTTVYQKSKFTDMDWEPELLRAINIAKKGHSHYITKAALVAKGLPVKIIS